MYNVTLARFWLECFFGRSVIDHCDEFSLCNHDFVTNEDYNHFDKQLYVANVVKHV